MERVTALVEKIKEQLAQNANKSTIRPIVQQLLAELEDTPLINNLDNNISVIMPYQIEVISEQNDIITKGNAPLEQLAGLQKPVRIFEDEVISENISSLPADVFIPADVSHSTDNVVLTTAKITTQKEVLDSISLEPIKDLRAAIGINDKFQFIKDLFGENETFFEDSIKSINAFKILAEAQFWIKKELREKYNWDEESLVVKHFDQLVKRRFS